MFEAIPMLLTPERGKIVEEIVRKVCAHETVFSDYQAACEQKCYERAALPEMCERCATRMVTVTQAFFRPNSIAWEVWKVGVEKPEVVGIVYVTDVRPGEDATGHYVFFDGNLSSKTGVLLEIIEWLFSDHPESGWKALRRLTVEIPDFAFALARHASKKLGFGGPFKYSMNGISLRVEGVKRKAVTWKGKQRDLLLLGKLNE